MEQHQFAKFFASMDNNQEGANARPGALNGHQPNVPLQQNGLNTFAQCQPSSNVSTTTQTTTNRVEREDRSLSRRPEAQRIETENVPIGRDELLRQAIQMQSEVAILCGQHPLELQFFFRTLEMLSMTPSGRWQLWEAVQRWTEAKSTGSVAEMLNTLRPGPSPGYRVMW